MGVFKNDCLSNLHLIYREYIRALNVNTVYGNLFHYLLNSTSIIMNTSIEKQSTIGSVSIETINSTLFIVYTRAYNGNLFMKVSKDGGLSWSGERVVLPRPSGFNYVQGSWVAADGNGILHVLSCVSYYANANKMACFYSRSEDEGESWSEPMMVSKNPGSFDKAWHGYILVDSNNTLYFAYHYTDGKTHLRRSENHGRTWGEERVFPYHGYFGLDSEDTLYYYYVANGDFFLMESRDKGENWSKAENVSKNGRVVSTGLLLLNNDEPGFIPVWVEQAAENTENYNIVIGIKEEKEIPKPTNKSIIITNTDWKNALSVMPIKLPVVVAEKISDNVLEYIKRRKPDYIYTLGFDLGLNNSFEIRHYDVPRIFFPNASRKIYVNSREKGIYASALGFVKNWPLIFKKENSVLDLSENSTEEIHKLFLEEINKTENGVNYFILANLNTPDSLLAGRLAGIRKAYIIGLNLSKPVYPNDRDLLENESVFWNELNNVSGVKNAIKEGFVKVNKMGLTGINSLIEGYFIGILPGIPMWVKDDPVELGTLFRDEEDRNWFLSDTDYGKMGSDYMFFSVGRFPEPVSTESILVNRIMFPENETENALIAAEYLHKYWPEVLLYVGGGLWQANTIDGILSSQGYNTTRLVEHRVDVSGLLEDMEPGNIAEFIKNTDSVSGKLSKYIGSSLSKIITPAALFFKLLYYVEQGLEVYLEYDWSSWELNFERIWESVEKAAENPPSDMNGFIESVIVGLLPEKHPELNKENLLTRMPDSKIIYYEGYGNGSVWILPNDFDWWNPWSSPYNGSVFLDKNELPWLRTNIVWDNSNLGAKEIGKGFVYKGSNVYIGSYGVTYHPYTSELDTRFFLYGKTVGEAFRNAVNAFIDDDFTFDLIQWILRGGTVKAKTLEEFSLFGDPKAEKDPVMMDGYEPNVNITCNASKCVTSVLFEPEYRIVEYNGNRTVVIETIDFLLRDFKPVLPLLKYEFYLSNDSVVYGYETSKESVCFENVSFPVLIPTPHGKPVNMSVPALNGTYPETYYRLSVQNVPDGRKRVLIVLSPFQRINDSCWLFYKKVRFKINHTLPVLVRIRTKDIKEGEVECVRIGVNDSSGFGKTIVTEISNGMESWVFNESLDNKTFVYCLHNLTSGVYRARSWVLGKGVLGPVIKSFRVFSKPALLVGTINATLNEGESGVLSLWLLDNSSKRIKNVTLNVSDLVCNGFVIERGNLSLQENGIVLSPWEKREIKINITVPDMQPPGNYRGVVFVKSNEGETKANITVDVPGRVELKVDGDSDVTVFPGKEKQIGLCLRNTGNVFANLTINTSGSENVCVDINKSVGIGVGEEKCINASVGVNGGTEKGNYSVLIWFGNYKKGINVIVPFVVYWSVEPEERACKLPGNCSVWFLFRNHKSSNRAMVANISANSSFFVYSWNEIEPGKEKRVYFNVSGYIRGGFYREDVNVSVENGMPENKSIYININAKEPEFSVRKRFIPKACFKMRGTCFPPLIFGVVNVRINSKADRVLIKDSVPNGFFVKNSFAWVFGKGFEKAGVDNGFITADLNVSGTKRVVLFYVLIPDNPEREKRETDVSVKAVSYTHLTLPTN